MSFFQTSDGKAVTGSTNFEAGGSLEPIPQGTKVRVIIESCAWRTAPSTGKDSIKTKSRVVEGEYANRVIFDTLDVVSDDTKRRDKHLKKFATLDTLSGAGIVEKGEIPSDEALYGFVGTVVTYTMGLFQPKPDASNPNPGPVNYVMGISSAETPVEAPAKPTARPAAPVKPAPKFNDFDGSDVPF